MNSRRCSKICLLVFLYFFLIDSNILYGQEIKALRIDEKIKVDGRLDEEDWDDADFLTGFTQFIPKYGEPASQKTFVKVLYDDKYIYFGIDCRDTDINRLSAKITTRDGDLEEDDAVAILLDTFNDGNNAYFFATNSIGTQLDGLITDNGRNDDTKWDGRWESEGFVTQSGYTLEIAVPFETLKFNIENSTWGLNVWREIPRNLESSLWAINNVSTFQVSNFGKITGLDLTNISIKNFSIIPYGQSQFQKGENYKGRLGGDIRYNISSNLGIEATINPDFATVEADLEQINFTRFELSYPEKRIFFQQGNENYSTRIEQFYSRRIGEIPWGVKLNGKVNKWKINALSTMSDPSTAGADVETGEKAFYNVFRINREFGKGSNIGIIGANRNYKNKNMGSMGLVATLFFTDTYGMTSQIIKSHGIGEKGKWAYFLRPAYDSKDFHFHVRYTNYDENIMENMNAVGFLTDDDRKEFDTNISKTFWINKKGIESIEPSINYNRYYSQSGVLRSWEIDNDLELKLFKKWELDLNYSEEFKRYEKDFRNREIGIDLGYDSKQGTTVSIEYVKGVNYDSDFEEITGGISLKLKEGWNATYHFTRVWFMPDEDEENSWIHYIRSTYYLNKDLYFKLFYQSRYRFSRGFFDPKFDLNRENIQLLFVWRVIPPFGSLQVVYQKGRTRITEERARGETLFTKISWVF